MFPIPVYSLVYSYIYLSSFGIFIIFRYSIFSLIALINLRFSLKTKVCYYLLVLEVGHNNITVPYYIATESAVP